MDEIPQVRKREERQKEDRGTAMFNRERGNLKKESCERRRGAQERTNKERLSVRWYY